MTNGSTSLLFILLMLAGAVTLSAQSTTIVTRDDTEYVGTMVSESADTIVIRTESGVAIAVPRNSISDIDYGPVRKAWAEGFWGVGAALGSPGGLNLVIERSIGERFGIRLSGGYGVIIGGAELTGLVRFARDGSADHSLLIGGGYMYRQRRTIRDADLELPYLQLGYNLHWGGFNLQLSVGPGLVAKETYLGGFQLGYVHRFQ